MTRPLRTVLAVSLALMSLPAAAHHVMDGAMPNTLASGLLSGLGHPIIGLDHFAFIVAAGALSVGLPRGALLPPLFIAAEMVGAALHAAGVDLPGGELGVALSVALIGLALALGWQARAGAGGVAALFALAGLWHGHALAESIVGAESTPLLGYFVGLIVIQTAIASVARSVTARCLASDRAWATAPRWTGVVVAVIGAGFLGLALTGA